MDDSLVSRQEAIDALERIFDRCEEIEAHLPEGDPDRVGYKMYPDWLKVWKYLRQVPSAQPERKTGRWIYEERKRLVNETDDGPVYRTEKWWLCSECGYAKGYQISKPSSNYCENCGAKMLKEGENIDS